MTLVYLTDQVYLHGGAERILIQKLNFWVELYDYRVILITTQQKGLPPFISINDKVEIIDLAVDYKEGVSFFNPKNFSKFSEHYKKLKKELDRINPDATFVISQTFTRFLPPFIKSSGKTFYEYHTSYHGFELGYRKLSKLGKIKNKLVKQLTNWIENKYSYIVFLNQIEFDFYRRRNSVIIPNFFTPVKDLNNVKSNTVISLGRIEYQKGYDLLIDIWKKVDKNIDGWELTIYGNGSDFEKLQNEIKNINFKNPVKLFNAIDNVDDVLSSSSIYAMSSRFETFPMVLLEAMSHGLPVVAFDCISGPRSILTDNQDGILVENNNLDIFAEKLIHLINDNDLRLKMASQSKENVKRFSPQSVMSLWNNRIVNK